MKGWEWQIEPHIVEIQKSDGVPVTDVVEDEVESENEADEQHSSMEMRQKVEEVQLKRDEVPELSSEKPGEANEDKKNESWGKKNWGFGSSIRTSSKWNWRKT